MISLKEIISPGLKYHIENNLPLSENVYRYSSEGFVELFAEARRLFKRSQYAVHSEDLDLILETDLGEYGMYEGKRVPLDLPMLNEGLEDTISVDFYGKKYEDLTDEEKLEVDKEVEDVFSNVYDDENDMEDYFNDPDEIERNMMNEAEYQGKKVQLNRPKRGGSKKFYVYVKDPKTKNVKKVSFGAKSGGQNLAVKFKDRGARASFAARHNCKDKKDKTTPGYWSCRIPRYWKSLGGGSNYSGYW